MVDRPLGEAFDFESITTRSGKVYRDIEIVSSDKNGLMFRHARGIAQESFSQLSKGIREMYEPVADVPDPSKSQLVTNPIAEPVGDEKASSYEEVSEVVLTLLIRQPVQTQGKSCGVHPCHWHPTPCHWPSHWTRFHPAHYLTNPVCRAKATKKFLQATGLLPHY